MAEMKDSGIHAIGRIPKEWNVVRTKYLSNISIGLVTTMTENYVEKEEGVPLIRNGNIRCNKIDVNGMVFLDKRFAEKNKHRQLHTGQIATVHTGDVGTSIVIPEEYDGGLGFATIQSTPYKGVSSEFLCWFYNSAAFKNQCIECSTGDGRQNLNLYDFVDLFVAIPKYDLQSKIASFLDKKCAEIDSLHTDIEKQIETLEEYKKSIITEAVTKGLDPDVEMKDSGIEWVGMIPKNWSVTRMQEIGTYKKGPFGSAITKNMFVEKDDNTYKVYEQKNAIYKNVELGYYYIPFSIYKRLKEFAIIPQDIIVSCAGTIGECYIMPNNMEKGIINQALMRIRLKENINKNYFIYVFDIILTYANLKYSNGSAMKNIPPFSVLKKLGIPLPSVQEQEKIANYLDDFCNEIDGVIVDKKKQLETLEQYKKSLIYEYVTGKKEVPDYE